MENERTIPAAEQWKPVVGYEDLYEVSASGKVRGLTKHGKYPAGRILKWSRRPRGYQAVALSRNGKRRQLFIHSLVMGAFVGDCPPGHQVNHKDGRKENNHVTNLEYVTHAENMAHAVENGFIPRGEHHREAKLTDEDIREIRKMIGKYPHRLIGLDFGVSHHAVGSILRGKTWKHVQ